MFNDVGYLIPVVYEEFVMQKACPIDQFLSQDFNKNDAGWSRNDLSALAAAQTKEQYDAILSRLKELPANSNLPKDVSLKDAFDYIKPKSMQTENEFADFAQFLTEKGLKYQEAAYAADFTRKLADDSRQVKESLEPAPSAD